MREYGDHTSRYIRPMAVEDDIDFVEVDTPELADEAEQIFGLQWDFVHGYMWAEDLEELPEFFEGKRVVRTARELAELARIGAFAEVEEIYRQLYE